MRADSSLASKRQPLLGTPILDTILIPALTWAAAAQARQRESESIVFVAAGPRGWRGPATGEARHHEKSSYSCAFKASATLSAASSGKRTASGGAQPGLGVVLEAAGVVPSSSPHTAAGEAGTCHSVHGITAWVKVATQGSSTQA